MSSQVTLTLPDSVLRTAKNLARWTGREVSDVLTDSIEASLNPSGHAVDIDLPVKSWSDAQVLAVADEMMPPAQDRRFGELLDLQQRRELSMEERTELAALAQIYDIGMLRKARAMREAVERGLREPIKP